MCIYVVCFSLSQLCLILIKSILKEIYAPKLQEFAYVTDGACSEEDILELDPNTKTSVFNTYIVVFEI